MRPVSLSPFTALSLMWWINSLGVSLVGFYRPILIGFGDLGVSFTLSGSVGAFLGALGCWRGLSGALLAIFA